MTCKRIALLAMACSCMGSGGAFAQAGGTAGSMAVVDSIFVMPNDCASGLMSALGERGFSHASAAADADAVLQVSITDRGRNLEDIADFVGFGARADYTARLTGLNGKTLFATSGTEGSITQREMCEDIGDEIAQRLSLARDR